MSDDIEKEKKKVELENLSSLIDRYAQSRSLPLLISLAMMIFNVVLLVSVVKLVVAYGLRIGQSGVLVIVVLVVLWTFFSSIWVVGKLLDRYGGCFYKRRDYKTPARKNSHIGLDRFCSHIFRSCLSKHVLDNAGSVGSDNLAGLVRHIYDLRRQKG